MACEDAAALATLLPLGISAKEIPERLELFEKLRKPRAEFLAHESWKRADHKGRTGSTQNGTSVTATHNLQWQNTHNMSTVFNDEIFGHDAVQNTKAAMLERFKEDGSN
jgi:2-polyprenyl-6-methoxyphenol hydroxylase-like FAD-dependent oxidoreductase